MDSSHPHQLTSCLVIIQNSPQNLYNSCIVTEHGLISLIKSIFKHSTLDTYKMYGGKPASQEYMKSGSMGSKPSPDLNMEYPHSIMMYTSTSLQSKSWPLTISYKRWMMQWTYGKDRIHLSFLTPPDSPTLINSSKVCTDVSISSSKFSLNWSRGSFWQTPSRTGCSQKLICQVSPADSNWIYMCISTNLPVGPDVNGSNEWRGCDTTGTMSDRPSANRTSTKTLAWVTTSQKYHCAPQTLQYCSWLY